jgi:sigma-B regulation protein RsbU (phosphoserine phosphatase)
MNEQAVNILAVSGSLDSLPCGVVIFGHEGMIQFVNNSFLSLLNYEKDELLTRNIESVFTVSTRVFYSTHIIPLIKLKGNVEEVFISLKRKDGEHVPVLFYAKNNSTGNEEMITAVITPVWQRKKYEDEILEAKKIAEKAIGDNAVLRHMKEELEIKAEQLDRQVLRLMQGNDEYAELSKVISHDFQEPIRKIDLFTDLLKKKYPMEAGNDFKRIHTAVDRLRSLTFCLDNFVSVDINKDKLQPISLNQVLSDAKEKAIAATGFGEFELISTDMPSIDGYPLLLTQLLLELIKNSIQYRSPNRKLEIHITTVIAQYNQYRVNDNRYKYIDFVKLELSDNGNGFDNKYADYVFKMFKRLDLEVPGMGFGLPLAKKIVDKHYGTISVKSKKGEGTVFQILLPIKA